MVDVVHRSDAVVESEDIVDRSEEVFVADRHRNKFGNPCFRRRKDLFFLGTGIEYLSENIELDPFRNAVVFKFFARELKAVTLAEFKHIDHSVRENADLFFVNNDINVENSGILYLFCLFSRDDFSRIDEDLAADGVAYGSGRGTGNDPAAERKFLIIFIASDSRQIVRSLVEEKIVDVGNRAVNRCGFAGTEFHIKLFESLISRSFGNAEIFFRRVFLFKRRKNAFVLAESLFDLLVGIDPERSDKSRDGKFLSFVDSDEKNVVRVFFVFDPRTAVGHNGSREKFITRFVDFSGEVRSGGSDKLGNNDTLRAVDDESSRLRHKGEVAEEYDLFLYFSGLFVRKTACNAEGSGISRVSFFTFRFGILGFLVDRIIDVIENDRSRVVDYVGRVFENIFHSLFHEPFVRPELNVDQVGDCLDLSDLREINSLKLTRLEIR